MNPFGLAFDPLGNLFSADCHTLPHTCCSRGAYYPSFGKPHDGLGFGAADDEALCTARPASPASSATHAEQFPAEYRGDLFIGNVITYRVNRDKLVSHGSSFEAIETAGFHRMR